MKKTNKMRIFTAFALVFAFVMNMTVLAGKYEQRSAQDDFIPGTLSVSLVADDEAMSFS